MPASLRMELHQVWAVLEECLAAGVLGVSMGLAYAPEFEYDQKGAVQALSPLKGTQIPIVTHIRNEGDGILPALEEVIGIAEELQIPLHVSHMKCIGKKNWGETPVKILKLLDQAERRGVKVDLTCTLILQVLPSWFTFCLPKARKAELRRSSTGCQIRITEKN